MSTTLKLTKWLSLTKLREYCRQGITNIILSSSSFDMFVTKFSHFFGQKDDDTIVVKISYGSRVTIQRSWRGSSGRPKECNGKHINLIKGLVNEGISQSKIADLTGFSQSTISRLIQKHFDFIHNTNPK